MCWEHEDKYDEFCFDFLWNDYKLFDDISIVHVLQYFNVIFKDHQTEMKCKNEFFELLSKWHREKSISPKNETKNM